jgi:hypothetical protein
MIIKPQNQKSFTSYNLQLTMINQGQLVSLTNRLLHHIQEQYFTRSLIHVNYLINL